MSSPFLTVEALGPPPWPLRRRGAAGIIRRRHTVTPDSEDPYVRHQDVIERALREVCRRHRLRADQAEEFTSVARVRLLDDDRAILRKHSGRASFRTFLAVVVARLFIDWCNSEWGRWRPSAEARRQGSLAIELERLVLRDGWPVHDAIEHVVSSGRAPREQCEAVWRVLPRAPRVSTLPLADVVDVPVPGPPPDLLVEREQGLLVGQALERAIGRLDADDRMLVRLQYWQSCSVADIARLHGLDQRELYRRFVRLRDRLRQELEAEGIHVGSIAGILGRFDTLQ